MHKQNRHSNEKILELKRQVFIAGCARLPEDILYLNPQLKDEKYDIGIKMKLFNLFRNAYTYISFAECLVLGCFRVENEPAKHNGLSSRVALNQANMVDLAQNLWLGPAIKRGFAWSTYLQIGGMIVQQWGSPYPEHQNKELCHPG